jgi:Tol biopolymer transport system component
LPDGAGWRWLWLAALTFVAEAMVRLAMKALCLRLALVPLILSLSEGGPECLSADEQHDANYRDLSYLGQELPGTSPQCFAPGLVSTEEYSETGCTFTPDGQELYFTRSGGDLEFPVIFVCALRGTDWTKPERVLFDGFGPHISPDGGRIFVSKYGYGKENQRTMELWVADREGQNWADLKYHGLGSRASMSDSLNLYYVDRSDDEDRGVIVVQRLIDGEYSESEALGGGVNTPHYEAHPCIADDESYLIFDSNRPGGYGEGDIYVCFRNDDRTWGDALNLGAAINTKGYEAYASISPDGKYLLYSSDRLGDFDLYWVKLSVIENLRQ